MSKLLLYLTPYKKQLIAGPAAKLAEAVLELMIPLVMAKIIDVGIPAGDLRYIYRMTFLALVISLAGYCFAITCQYLASIVSQGFGTLLRNALIKKISEFSHKETGAFGTESLLNRATADVVQLQQAVAMFIRLVIRAPFLCVGGIAAAYILNKKLALILLAFIPIFSVISYAAIKITAPVFKEAQKLFDRTLTIIKENITGARVIRAFGRKNDEIRRYKEKNAELAGRYILAGTINSALSPLTAFITNMAIVLILRLGAPQIRLGFLTTGELIALINYASQIAQSLIIVANLTILYNRSFASANRVVEVLNVSPAIVSGGEISGIGDIAVEFKNVNFNYFSNESNTNNNRSNSLTNISFKLKKGEVLGIIGGVGAGKSTLLNLIPRFYDATGGEVLVNGINVKNWDLVSLRNLIGCVPQTSRLFRGTIASNIRSGKKEATDEELQTAAEISQAAEFIEARPEKFSSKVELAGQNLSGGQKQRLAIARAVVRKPEILILDDSASALDYATDSKLRASLKKLPSTKLIVSQRINAVMEADSILVLENGKIEGAGTHEELLKTSEFYRGIYDSQAGSDNF